MAAKTTNYNLVKPSYDENADIAVINGNMDIIDTKMKELDDKTNSNSVEWNQLVNSGTKIAEITVGENKKDVYAPAGGGSTITVDAELSTESENPVQNKVITAELNGLKSDLIDITKEVNEIDTNTFNNVLDVVQPSEINKSMYVYRYSDTKVAFAPSSSYSYKLYLLSDLPDVFIINTRFSLTSLYYAFVDDDNNIISVSNGSESAYANSYDIVRKPKLATKLYLNYLTNAETDELNPYGVKVVSESLLKDDYKFYKSKNLSNMFELKGYFNRHSSGYLLFDDDNNFNSYIAQVFKGEKIRIKSSCHSNVAGYILVDMSMTPYFVKHTTTELLSYDDEIIIEKDGYICYTLYGSSLIYKLGNLKEYGKLYNKKIGFDGDSITCASGDGVIGYVKQIESITGCITQNLAVDGGTLASGTIVTEGVNRHHICESISSFDIDTDIYCISGGYNDWGLCVPLGTYTDDYNSDYNSFDTTTLYGALDYIFTYLMTERSGKPILYILIHIPLGFRKKKGFSGALPYTMEEYFNAIKKMLNKYSIPYVNLYDESPLMTVFDALKTYTVNGDGVHPNTEGYGLYYVPQILNKLEEICPIEIY